MTIIRPYELGYVDLGSKDVSAMESYYENVLGFTQSEKTGDGTVYYSLGMDHHNVAIFNCKEEYLKSVGWKVSNEFSTADIQKYLSTFGIISQVKTDYKPGISKLVEFKDYDGNNIHLYSEIEKNEKGFPVKGIQPMRMGHIAIAVKDMKKTTDFYKEVLNFWHTDTMSGMSDFLTCNNLHHTLNISQSKKSLVHHIAYELTDFSQHKNSGDILAANRYAIEWGPSRHSFAGNIASYHCDPEGRITELYTDMDIYQPELNQMEPRFFHKEHPLKPQVWTDSTACAWGTKFDSPGIFNRMRGEIEV